jgi:hypothetical protein
MLRRIVVLTVFLGNYLFTSGQILGGGTLFSNAVVFDQSWLTNCPSAGTSLSNQVAFEPTTAMDPCGAPAPACASGTTGSDIWFKFYAQLTTATIVVNPSASFNCAIQAFSGSACPGLTNIGCIDAGGNNAVETLSLSGLTINQIYYFRVFGASNGVSNRTGTYTFCGSTQLGSTLLAVEISSFNAAKQNGNAVLNWVTESETNNSYFEIERSSDGSNYQPIGKIAGAGTSSITTHYSFTDIAALTTAVSYYRLKEVSSNGSYKYSAVAIVRMDNRQKKLVAILSNPVTDKLNVRISSDVSTGMNLKIVNNLGQVAYQQKGALVKGDNIFIISNPNLSKGIYTLQVIINNELLSTKFISAK